MFGWYRFDCNIDNVINVSSVKVSIQKVIHMDRINVHNVTTLILSLFFLLNVEIASWRTQKLSVMWKRFAYSVCTSELRLHKTINWNLICLVIHRISKQQTIIELVSKYYSINDGHLIILIFIHIHNSKNTSLATTIVSAYLL